MNPKGKSRFLGIAKSGVNDLNMKFLKGLVVFILYNSLKMQVEMACP